MNDFINPYIAGNPVTGEAMFFGRQDVFTFIRQTLRGQHRDQVIVLYGQRRTGKTSILYQMHRHIDPRYLCIFIDLHGLSIENEAIFIWELANQIRRVLERDHGIVLPRPEQERFLADHRSAFANDFLDQVWQTIGDRHILLMLDEAIRLQEQIQAGKLDRAVFEYLRHLMQHYEQLNFLFSLGSGLEQMEKEYAFLFNVALYKKISFLERESAVELITRPVQDYYEVTPAGVENILAKTAGHPYFTQLLCHSLFNRWQQHRPPAMTDQDVDAVIEEVVERGLAVLKHVWEESSAGEKIILAGLAAASGERNRPVTEDEILQVWAQLGVAIPPDEMARAMQSLTARDLIHIRPDETVAFRVNLQLTWLRNYQRLEWVREEVRSQIGAWSAEAAAGQAAPLGQPVSPGAGRRFTGPWPAVAAAIVVLVFLTLLAVSQNWGPFDRAASPTPAAAGGTVKLGGEASQVNGLVLVDGNIWAATEGGLVRWTTDGRWARFSGPDIGFDDDWNQTIAAAPDGSLWIGGGGVSHVEPAEDEIQFLQYFNRDDDLGMTRVRALLVEPDESVWAGGPFDHETPVSFYDGESWQGDSLSFETLVDQGLDINVWSILRTRDGSLWFGLVDDGILRWDGEGWRHWGADEGVGGSELDDGRIRALLEDDHGTLWAAASDRGLLRYQPDDERWEQVDAPWLTGTVTAIAQLADGSLASAGGGWLARSEDGGNRWDLVATTEDGIGEEITAVVLDEEGSLWIGAYAGGVSVLTNGVWRHLQH